MLARKSSLHNLADTAAENPMLFTSNATAAVFGCSWPEKGL